MAPPAKDYSAFETAGATQLNVAKPGLRVTPLAGVLLSEDEKLLQESYESSIEENKLPAQHPTLEGLKTILDQLALKDPKQKRPSLRISSVPLPVSGAG
jgi:hypothetical protein